MRFEQIDEFLKISKVVIGISPAIQDVDKCNFFGFRFIGFRCKDIKGLFEVLMGFFHCVSCQTLFTRLHKIIYGLCNGLPLFEVEGQGLIELR